MKYLLILLVGVGGCRIREEISEEEVIRQVKYCESNGMKPSVYRYLEGGQASMVACNPKEVK